MNRIAVIDADAIGLMGNKLLDGTSHLSLTLQYFDEAYIHKYIYENETFKQELKDHIEELEIRRLVVFFSDEDILNLINAVLENDSASCATYISYLQQALGSLNPNNPLNQIFLSILNTHYSSIAQLVSDLNQCDNSIPNGTGAGEIKTLILTQALHFTTYSEINLFLSNDKKARQLLVTRTAGQVEGCSPIASFLLLKQAGVSKSIASSYFATYDPNWKITVKKNNHFNVTKTYQELFDDIFNPNIDMEITVSGLLNYI